MFFLITGTILSLALLLVFGTFGIATAFVIPPCTQNLFDRKVEIVY